MLDLVIDVGVVAALLLLGLTAGGVAQRRHLRSLAQREAAFADVLVTDLRGFPMIDASNPRAQLVFGQAVIATDYLKTSLASLKNLVGGQVRSLEILAVRARREAMLRMIESAQLQGFDAVCNVRVDTADISSTKSSAAKGVPYVGVIVSGTAYHRISASNSRT